MAATDPKDVLISEVEALVSKVLTDYETAKTAAPSAPGSDKTPSWHSYLIPANTLLIGLLSAWMAFKQAAPTVTSDVTVTTPAAATAPANISAPGSPGPAVSIASSPAPAVMGPSAPAAKPPAPEPYRPTTPLGKAALAYRSALPAALKAMDGKSSSEAATAYRAAADPFEAALSEAVAPGSPPGSFDDAAKAVGP